MAKTLMEKFLDKFLSEDLTVEEILELIDVDVYELLEVAMKEGLVDEELVERLL